MVLFGDKDDDRKINTETAIAADNSLPEEIVQRHFYYAYGMEMEGPWQHTPPVGDAYRYNGKELVGDLGMDLSDYGARYYDAVVGRWTGVDPLAEKYYAWSSYNYVLGNPISFTDPTGMGPENNIIVNDEGTVIEIEENNLPHRLFRNTSEAKNEINLNEPDVDRIQLGAADLGDQLVHFLSNANVDWLFYDSGADNIYMDPLSLGWASYDNFDYGSKYFTASLFPYPEDAHLQAANYHRMDSRGGFLVFENDPSVAYNLPDGGNFMWGATRGRGTSSSMAAYLGSNLNSLLTSGEMDSAADQRAIFAGFNAYKNNYQFGPPAKGIQPDWIFSPKTETKRRQRK